MHALGIAGLIEPSAAHSPRSAAHRAHRVVKFRTRRALRARRAAKR
jgi:hypothetical protein